MNTQQFRIVLLVVLITTVLISFVWEFLLEELVSGLFSSDYHQEERQERWEYVISAAAFVAISLIYPYFIGKRLIQQQHELSEKIKRLSEEDYLTGLYNRRKMSKIIEDEVDRCSRYGCNFAIILCDLDHFKSVNDNYSHVIGDDVLREVSDLLGTKIRKSDQLARWGGEEFLIFCPQTKQRGASSLAEKLRATIEQHEFNVVGHLTCSFGITTFTQSDDLRILLNKADTALYAAKDKGRNCVELSTA